MSHGQPGGPRIGNVAGRATLAWDAGTADVAQRSDGRYGPDPQSLFCDWARSRRPDGGDAFEAATLGPPGPAATVAVTSPRLDWEVEFVVAIGRQAEHVREDL